jgi:hypothetical protein
LAVRFRSQSGEGHTFGRWWKGGGVAVKDDPDRVGAKQTLGVIQGSSRQPGVDTSKIGERAAVVTGEKGEHPLERKPPLDAPSEVNRGEILGDSAVDGLDKFGSRGLEDARPRGDPQRGPVARQVADE